MSLTHEISDTIDWENKWNLSHTESDNTRARTTNTLSSAFYYSLTNQLDLGVTAKLTDDNDRVGYENNNVRNDEIDKSLNVGIKYRLK